MIGKITNGFGFLKTFLVKFWKNQLFYDNINNVTLSMFFNKILIINIFSEINDETDQLWKRTCLFTIFILCYVCWIWNKFCSIYLRLYSTGIVSTSRNLKKWLFYSKKSSNCCLGDFQYTKKIFNLNIFSI